MEVGEPQFRKEDLCSKRGFEEWGGAKYFQSEFIDSNRCLTVVSDNIPFGIKTEIKWCSTFTIRKIVKYLETPKNLREICYSRG